MGRGGGGVVTMEAEIRSLNSVENPELTKDPSFESAYRFPCFAYCQNSAFPIHSPLCFPLLLEHRVTCAMNNVSDMYL